MLKGYKTRKFLHTTIVLGIISSSFFLYAYSGGIVGKTQKNGNGCTCHGSSSSSVTAVISGPDSLLVGQTGVYTFTISGGPAVKGGTNIAASSGTLSPFDAKLRTESGELTHTSPFAPTSGVLSVKFNYTAPASVGNQTLYANGNSVNDNGGNDGDQWNFAANKIVKVVLVVPVELTAFNSSVSGNSVKLDWSTSTEKNNSGFEIERSLAGKNSFEKIAFVKGNGTTTESNNYSYVDGNVATGKFEYRIKQVDFNGAYSYFNLATQVDVTAPAAFQLNQNYPNPFNPATTISFSLPVAGNVSIKIYNSLGSEVKELINEERQAGYYNIPFDASELSSGVYYYAIKVNNSNNQLFSTVKKMMLIK